MEELLPAVLRSRSASGEFTRVPKTSDLRRGNERTPAVQVLDLGRAHDFSAVPLVRGYANAVVASVRWRA